MKKTYSSYGRCQPWFKNVYNELKSPLCKKRKKNIALAKKQRVQQDLKGILCILGWVGIALSLCERDFATRFDRGRRVLKEGETLYKAVWMVTSEWSPISNNPPSHSLCNPLLPLLDGILKSIAIGKSSTHSCSCASSIDDDDDDDDGLPPISTRFLLTSLKASWFSSFSSTKQKTSIDGWTSGNFRTWSPRRSSTESMWKREEKKKEKTRRKKRRRALRSMTQRLLLLLLINSLRLLLQSNLLKLHEVNKGTEKFSHNNNNNIHFVLLSSWYANFSRLLSISIFEKQTRCAATLLTRAWASVNQCLIFHMQATLTRANKKNKRTQCLIFHLVCVEKWGGAKSNEWVYPQKQACLKKKKKTPLQNSKATTRAEGSNTCKTNQPTKNKQHKCTSVIRDMRKFALSSPCLWASFHPPNPSFSGIRNVKGFY